MLWVDANADGAFAIRVIILEQAILANAKRFFMRARYDVLMVFFGLLGGRMLRVSMEQCK